MMELRLVEQTSPAATPPIRKARRRSLGGRVEKPAPPEVPVTGPVECDRYYTLVARSEELVGDGELRVRHASEVDPDAEQQKLTSATGNGAPPKKPARNNNHSNTKKKKVDSAASSSGDEEEEELQVIEEDDEAEEEGKKDEQPSGKPNVHFVWQLRSSPDESESESEGDSGNQFKDKRPAPEPLPINAAKLQLLSHDPANGEARFELKISSAHFGKASSPSALTHVALEASACKDQPPLRFQSPPARTTAITGPRQADALLPLAVKTRPTTADAGRAPSPRQPPPTELGAETSGGPAEDVAASSAATSGSMPSLLPGVLPPLHSVPLPLGPFPIPPHPAETNGAGQSATPATSGGDMWADFASTVKAATLKSLQKGKDVPETKDQTTVLPMTDATPSPSSPSLRRSKRKSRREDEVGIEPDKASSSATESAATGKETSAAPAAAVRGQQALIPRDLRQQGVQPIQQQPPPPPTQEGLRKWYDEQNVRTRSSEILQFLIQAQKRIDPKFVERFSALHTKLFPVFEQFAHPDTQHTLILILLHALTLTGYCVDLIRFCYWVKEFSSLAVDRVIEQATELSAELVQLQFQKEVEEKLHGCLTTLLETLTALSEIISGPVYESYQPEKEPVEKTSKGKKFISLAKGNAVPWIKEWLKSSYAEVQGQSVAKKMVYKDYLAYCNRVGIEPTTSSVLGKIFREVFPFVNTRRLGSRNNNITYYSNIGPTSSLLAHSTSSAQAVAASSSSLAPSSPTGQTAPHPASPPAVTPSSTRVGSRSRSASLNARNPSPPSSASHTNTSSSSNGDSASSSSSASKPTFHMGSFRSSSPTSSFSYYPSASYYSAASSASSSSGPRSSSASSTMPSGSSSSSSGSGLKRSTAALPAASSFASAPIRPSSPTPTSAFLPGQPTATAELGAGPSAYPGGYPSTLASSGSSQPPAASALPHYFTLPPIPNPAAGSSTAPSAQSQSSAASAAQSSQAAAAAAAGYNPAMFLPHAAALSAILTSFPHLLSYGLPAYPPPPSAGGLPPGYPAYPGYPPYPYPYPYPAPDQPHPSAEAAAAAMAQLPIDPALLAQLAANNPMAFVKRELRDEEQHVKEVEVQEHAMALDSARRRRDRDERDEASSGGGGRTPSPRTGRRHRASARQESEDESPSSESAEEPTRSKRQRRTTKPRN